MRDKFNQFMYGRYGSDDLSKFILIICAACLVLNIFTGSRYLYLFAIALLAASYYRMFSRDHARRYAENQKYLTMRDNVLRKLGLTRRQIDQRKQFHIYQCPSCRQKIRIPRGKGKIEVTCPKCRTKFTKRS